MGISANCEPKRAISLVSRGCLDSLGSRKRKLHRAEIAFGNFPDFQDFPRLSKLLIMDWKIFATAFVTLFLAELGDKTQLAIITLTAKTDSKWTVFIGASLALVFVSLLAALVGGVLTQFIPTEWLQRIVAVAFILIGILMLAGIL